MEKKDFAVRDDYKKKVQFQKSGLPYCPVCAYEYTPLAMMGLILAATNRHKMERKIWTPE